MGKVQKYRRGIGAFISSEKGQRFFNFAYSIGAAIVIWGALFKILHLPGGNALLSIGMGTEVLMFVLTAFDRPPKEYHWEDVFPALNKDNETDNDDNDNYGAITGDNTAAGTTVIIGSAQTVQGPVAVQGQHPQPPAQNQAQAPQPAPVIPITATTPGETTAAYLDTMADLANEMQHLRASTQALNNVSDTLLESYRAITENSENITRSSQGYVEQMQALNRNITGLNTIYEIQLKSISSQLDAIDRVNQGIKEIRDMYEKSAGKSASYCEETEKMARNMQRLNNIYERMITAMTINNPMMPRPLEPEQHEQKE